MRDLRCRERPPIPRPVADKRGQRERVRRVGWRWWWWWWSRSAETALTAVESYSRGLFAEEIMQFAIWLLGLTCHLSLLVRVALQQRLHPKQGEFLRQIPRVTRRFVDLHPRSPERLLLLQSASLSSCHRMKSPLRCASMTSESRSRTRFTSGGGGGAWTMTCQARGSTTG